MILVSTEIDSRSFLDSSLSSINQLTNQYKKNRPWSLYIDFKRWHLIFDSMLNDPCFVDKQDIGEVGWFYLFLPLAPSSTFEAKFWSDFGSYCLDMTIFWQTYFVWSDIKNIGKLVDNLSSLCIILCCKSEISCCTTLHFLWK